MKYFSITENSEAKIVVRGSKFIARCFPVGDEEEVQRELQALRKRYYDATHHCFAWKLPEENGQDHFRYSDDGEPSGTAGKPIFDMLEKYELNSILCVVTRYFGGTKLGTGGLVRAYSEAAETAITAAEIQSVEIGIRLSFRYPYEYQTLIERDLKGFELLDRNTAYGEEIDLELECREEDEERLLVSIRNATQGKIIGIRLKNK